MMGDGLGLAVLASVAGSRTDALVADGQAHASALVGGDHAAFMVGAGFAALAALLTALFMCTPSPAAEPAAPFLDSEPELAPKAHQFVAYASPCEVCPEEDVARPQRALVGATDGNGESAQTKGGSE
jgi:hypothetical protein